jgi:hypothetical protein
MAPVFALAEIGIAACVVFFACKSFRERGVAGGWWLILGSTALVAGVVGAWFGFNFSYQPSSRVVVYSFPVPGAFHVLETYDDGTQQWVDFVTPAPLLVAVANACLLLSIPVAWVWLAHSVASRFHHPPKLGAAA